MNQLLALLAVAEQSPANGDFGAIRAVCVVGRAGDGDGDLHVAVGAGKDSDARELAFGITLFGGFADAAKDSDITHAVEGALGGDEDRSDVGLVSGGERSAGVAGGAVVRVVDADRSGAAGEGEGRDEGEGGQEVLHGLGDRLLKTDGGDIGKRKPHPTAQATKRHL